jgi:hypothetical protein
MKTYTGKFLFFMVLALLKSEVSMSKLYNLFTFFLKTNITFYS